MYARYQKFAGETAMSLTAFGKRIEGIGIKKRRSGGIWYDGIGLRPEIANNA